MSAKKEARRKARSHIKFAKVLRDLGNQAGAKQWASTAMQWRKISKH